ncbi:unnamed protein product [Clonostachys rhizophaga]|uniref:Uncharacterized protein n=1 Tax=Clonostachys rhizophaga TaxID=160324 RepID=A0A9N9VT10_9HYPO|nr:unnamed protein product [Clonostachys rhizophaga]
MDFPPGPDCASQRAGRAGDSVWGPSTNGRPGAVAGVVLPPVSQSEVEEGDEVAESSATPPLEAGPELEGSAEIEPQDQEAQLLVGEA